MTTACALRRPVAQSVGLVIAVCLVLALKLATGDAPHSAVSTSLDQGATVRSAPSLLPASPVSPEATTEKTTARRAAAPPAAGREDIAAPGGAEEVQVVNGVLRPGDTLDSSLRKNGVPAQVRQAVLRTLADCLDFRRLRPGDAYQVEFAPDGTLRRCRYQAGPLEIYEVTPTADGYAAGRQAIEVTMQLERIEGEIATSLFDAFTAAGERPQLVYAFADIFASKIDFNTETRQGDRFVVLVPKYYKDGAFLGYGTISYAAYRGKLHQVAGYYFRPTEDEPGGYFDAQGNDLGSAFIRSPVPVGRITSRFTLRRRHPILGRVLPHLGVDLAAPVGTPVMATADGVVVFAGRRGGFGRQVILKHPGGFKTYYGHLSRIAKKVRKGRRVRQKQIIGYVGASGLATGPHLDYRLAQNGRFKNPFAVEFQPRRRLSKGELARFAQERQALETMLRQERQGTVLAARTITVSGKDDISFL